MGRILAIDYGRKRTGLAVTDRLQLIATALDTIPSQTLVDYLTHYFAQESVETIVVGKPLMLNGSSSETEEIYVMPMVKNLKRVFPNLEIVMWDERFTSKIAFQSMIAGGLKKKDRQEKGTIDRVSAVLLLQSYLEQKQNQLQHESI